MGTFREIKKENGNSSKSEELKAAYAAIAGLSEEIATLTATVAKIAATSTTAGSETK